MSAVISIQFIKSAEYNHAGGTHWVTLRMDSGPLGAGGGSFGGMATLHVNPEEAQMIIDALTEARDAQTGDTP